MKTIFFQLFLAVFFSTTFLFLSGCNNYNLVKQPSIVPAKDLGEEYDLREECGKRSEEWFKSYQRNYPGDKLTYPWKTGSNLYS